MQYSSAAPARRSLVGCGSDLSWASFPQRSISEIEFLGARAARRGLESRPADDTQSRMPRPPLARRQSHGPLWRAGTRLLFAKLAPLQPSSNRNLQKDDSRLLLSLLSPPPPLPRQQPGSYIKLSGAPERRDLIWAAPADFIHLARAPAMNRARLQYPKQRPPPPATTTKQTIDPLSQREPGKKQRESTSTLTSPCDTHFVS